MTQDYWYIQNIDHRVSTALIFFLLLMVMSNLRRKEHFALRVVLSLAGMIVLSWGLRTIVDTLLVGTVAQGIGYSIYTLLMGLAFMVGYGFCYQTNQGELLYLDLLALTIFKLSWNIFKTASYGSTLLGIGDVWSRYSIVGAGVSYVVYAVVCVICCHCMKEIILQSADIPLKPMIATAVVFYACQASLEFCGTVFTASPQGFFLYYFCALLYTATNLSVLALVAQRDRAQRDNESMQAFINNKIHYYQVSRDGITSLQVKCHDLKHQIKAIRSQIGKENFEKYLDRLQDSIDEYGTVVDCGNEAINVVLTEKNILCLNSGVKFSYIIDGTLFDFLSEMEVYSLFGNVLDNALESCSKVKDPEKRMISLKAVYRGDVVVLHVENFFDDELVMVDGIPVTTKSGTGHGFGLRSVREIAEHYGGTVSVDTEGHIFKLTAILHPPAEQKV